MRVPWFFRWREDSARLSWKWTLLLVMIGVALIWWSMERERVGMAKIFIEVRYAREIEHLKTTMLGIDPKFRDDQTELARIAGSLAPMFDAPEIRSVSWSGDGNQGNMDIKGTSSSGYQTSWLFAQGDDTHSLSTGGFFEGNAIYVYRGFVPSAKVRREYKIVFYADRIRALMSSEDGVRKVPVK